MIGNFGTYIGNLGVYIGYIGYSMDMKDIEGIFT